MSRGHRRIELRRLLALCGLLALAGCSGNGSGLDQNGRPAGDGAGGALTADFQSIQDHVLTPICTQCHAGAAAPEGMSLEQGRSYAALVGIASQEVPSLLRVKPGDPDASYLIHKISGTQQSGERMPRGLPPLPDSTIAIIRQWIAAGALPPASPPPPVESSAYSVTHLASNGATAAHVNDSRLHNPWGIAFSPGGPLWIADNHAQAATLYDGTGTSRSAAIALPDGSNPTGVVFNGAADFMIGDGSAAVPATFIFDGEGGTLAAWAQGVDAAHALTVYDGSAGGASYKGLAMASSGDARFLYATDFHNGRIDVFDGRFARVTTAGAFADPALPAGYAPFSIQNIGGELFVAYAVQDDPADAHDNRSGAGLGLIDVYDAEGHFLRRLVAPGGALDAPWGMTLAPPGSGNFAGDLLVGNFGDGRINAFDPSSGRWIGAMKDAGGAPIEIPGLWGIAFGNGAHAQPATTLFFAAGINDETDGLYGRIDLGATPPDSFTPVVTLHAPGGDLSGAVTLGADASDDRGVTRVEFFADGNSIGIAAGAPYTLQWDTSSVANGAHALTAQASDAASNNGISAPVTVNVANLTADTTPPSVTLSAPAGDVNGTVTLEATAQDDTGVVQVRFFADGSAIGTLTRVPFSLAWDTTTASNGAHTLTAQAQDAAGNTGDSAPVGIDVANATLTQVQSAVFGPICSPCHNGSTPRFLPGSMNLRTTQKSYTNTVNFDSEENPALKRILPGDPDNSYLIQKVEGAPGISGARMPNGCPDSQPCLDQATIDRMRQWVRAGALNN